MTTKTMTTKKEFNLYDYNETVTLKDLHKYNVDNIKSELIEKYGRYYTEKEYQELPDWQEILSYDDPSYSEPPNYLIKEENRDSFDRELDEAWLIIDRVQKIAEPLLNKLDFDLEEQVDGGYLTTWANEDLRNTIVLIAKDYFKEYCIKHYAKDTAWYIAINWNETVRILSKNYDEIVVNNITYYYESSEGRELFMLTRQLEETREQYSWLNFNSKTLLEYRDQTIGCITKLKEDHYALEGDEEDYGGELITRNIKKEVSLLTDRLAKLNSCIEELSNIPDMTWEDGIDLIGKDVLTGHCKYFFCVSKGLNPDILSSIEYAIDWDLVAKTDYKMISLLGFDFYYYYPSNPTIEGINPLDRLPF